MAEETSAAPKSLSKVDKLMAVIRQEPGIASLILRSRAPEFDMKPDDVSQGLFVLSKQQRIRYGAGENGTSRNRPCFASENAEAPKAKIGRPRKEDAAAKPASASGNTGPAEKKKIGRPRKEDSVKVGPADSAPSAAPTAQTNVEAKPEDSKKASAPAKAPKKAVAKENISASAAKAIKTRKSSRGAQGKHATGSQTEKVQAKPAADTGHTTVERLPSQGNNAAQSGLEGLIAGFAEQLASAFANHVGQHIRAQISEKVGAEVSSALTEAMGKLSSSIPQFSQHHSLAHNPQRGRPALAAPKASAAGGRKRVVIIGVREKFAERIRSEFAGNVDMAFIAPSESSARVEELLSQADEVVTLPKAGLARNTLKLVKAHRGFSEIGAGVAALREKLRTMHA